MLSLSDQIFVAFLLAQHPSRKKIMRRYNKKLKGRLSDAFRRRLRASNQFCLENFFGKNPIIYLYGHFFQTEHFLRRKTRVFNMKKLQNLLLLLSFLAVVAASCGRQESGQLVGVLDRPKWKGINPYGMVYV
ncbi:MAG TPA: hypothetical protein PK971_05200, partial [Saprospiraceae bacterium]|nr:hypothetical protein [Saprospiraceae bacterium]